MADETAALLAQLEGAGGHGGEISPYTVNGLLEDSRHAIESLRTQLAEANAALEWAADYDDAVSTAYPYGILTAYREVNPEQAKEFSDA